MSYDFSLAMVHWGDKPERVRNARVAWNNLKDMTRYLQVTGVNCEARLYDFSPQQVMPEAIHLPFPAGTYEKCAKINRILQLHLDDPVCDEPEHIGLFDSDFMVQECDWYTLIENLRYYERTQPAVLLFQPGYVQSPMTLTDDGLHLDSTKTRICKQETPTGGRFFVVPFRGLVNIGGFDERFKVWGAEDHDVVRRLNRSGIRTQIAANMLIVHLYHRPEKRNRSDPEYARQFDTYYKGDQTVVRNGGPLKPAQNTMAEKNVVSPTGVTLT
jgi:hypothetical protein